MSLRFYILDTETTGLKADFHEIHQISIIRCDDLTQMTRDIKVRWPERARLDALAVSGKKPGHLKFGEKLITSGQMVDQVSALIADDGQTPEHRVIIGHNIHTFDRRFLWEEWKRAGKIFPANHWLCTQKLGREWAKWKGRKLDSYKLESLVKFAGFEMTGIKHTAGDDAQNNWKLWLKMKEEGFDYLPFIQRNPHAPEMSTNDTEDYE